jgi:hypothetical protein
MKRRTSYEASGRGARDPNVAHSATATNIAPLHLRLRRHGQNPGGGESSGREPTKSDSDARKHTSGLIMYQIEPFARAIVSL